MAVHKELNHKLFIQREENIKHPNFNDELGFYSSISNGDISAVKKFIHNLKNPDGNDLGENGILSLNPLQNARYHFVVLTAVITRFCVEAGLEHETAYTLSDIYISKMDLLPTIDSIVLLQDEMVLDYTSHMMEHQKSDIYAIQVMQAIDYIYDNLHKRLTVEEIAANIQMNSSYLSKLFKKETGETVSQYIRKKKIEAAANMIKFSDYSLSDITEYFGFATQSHFSQCFKEQTGYTPNQYRKQFYQSDFL